MPLWRRVACIALGGALLWFAATLLLPEIENGVFVRKLSLAAFAAASVGGLLVVIGAFPNFTRDW